MPVYIHAIRTQVPATKVPQDRSLAFVQRFVAKTPAQKAFLQKIYDGSKIETRYTVIPDYSRLDSGEFTFFPRNDSLEPLPSTGTRNRRFVVEAEALALAAARALFAAPEGATPAMGELAPGLAPQDISHLVSVSCTGFSAPGFDLAVQKGLGLPATTTRTHLGFMGCYATLPALRTAYQICQADPKARVLVIGVELCSLHFQTKLDADNLVANALFADGAYAMVVSGQASDGIGARYSLGGFSTTLIPDSGSQMAWDIGDTGFDMKLSSYVPTIIESNISEIIDRICQTLGHSRRNIARWAIHPGGRAILEKVADQLGLVDEALSASYRVMAQFGNMSAVTMAFVLAELAAQGATSSATTFATAFGPGLTVEAALLDLLPAPAGRDRLRHGVRSANLPRLFPAVRNRWRLPELMDSPQVALPALLKTIRQFGFINRWLSVYRTTLQRELFDRLPPDLAASKTWTVLDVGSGGADIPRWVVREARRRGLAVKITCLDPDERITAQTERVCADYPEITLLAGSGAAIGELGRFDFVICNHVLHHLTETEVANLITAADRIADRNIIFTDLARSSWGYVGYTLFAALFLRRSLAAYDGKLSILRSFRFDELHTLLDRSELGHLQLRSQMPARLIVTRKPEIAEPALNPSLGLAAGPNPTTVR